MADWWMYRPYSIQHHIETNHELEVIPGCSLSVRHLFREQDQARSTRVTRTKRSVGESI